MNVQTRILNILGIGCAVLNAVAEPQLSSPESTASAPPTPPPIVVSTQPATEPSYRTAANLYSIGEPTPEEQLYVEMINRARANPVAEALIFATTTDPEVLSNYDYFDVNLPLMQQQFAIIQPAPPVAPNAQLTAAARRHSQDMLEKSFQGHVGSDGSTFALRITQAGYVYSTIAENVYAAAESVFHGHAGFEVDWGFGPGGMQSPPGHRNTIHNSLFREVGVGVVFGTNEPEPGSQIPGTNSVGPSLVTQEFGTRQGATPLITGVAYYDANTNNFYDIGEGIGGVNVAVSGTTTQAITAQSGGYAVPVAGNGNYTVTFSAPGFTTAELPVVVALGRNQKIDFRPTYTPPAVSGTASPAINIANNYAISPVPGAVAYQWRSFQLLPAALEGAESGTADTVTINQSTGYDVFEPIISRSGNYSFHLAFTSAGVREQTITLNARYIATENSTLRFHSRLGFATSTTYAKVHVSTDNGATWQEVFSQQGLTGSANETSFVSRSVNLAPFAGSTIKVRFSFLPTGSSYVNVGDGVGWYIDDILLEGAFQITNEQTSSESATPSFTFQPTAVGNYVLQARARATHLPLPWGPERNVTAMEGQVIPPELRVSNITVANGRAIIDVEVVSGSVPASWVLQSKRTLTEEWGTASTQPTALSATRFRFDVLARPSDTQHFYRVSAN
jgi:hypothetical protein